MAQTQQSQTPVIFISTWINNPEFIPIQRNLINKFCKENVKFLAVLDGKTTPCFTNFGDTTMRQRQIDICKANSIDYVEVPPDFHSEPGRKQLFDCGENKDITYDTSYRNTNLDPSSRTAVSNQFGWRIFHTNLKKWFNHLVMIQSDVFPFTPFSVREMLDGNSLLYKDQHREPIHYAWDGFLMFDFSQEPTIPWNEWNFDSGIQDKTAFTDTGGGTWTILPKIMKKKNIKSRDSLQWTKDDSWFETLPMPIQKFLLNDNRNEGNRLFSEIKHFKFIHLRGGGNWEYMKDLGKGLQIQTERFEAFTEAASQLLGTI